MKFYLKIAFVLATSSANECPDLHQYRTRTVINGLNTTKLDGRWYEIAYEDIAQILAECQFMENTRTDTGFEQKFHVTYIDKLIPFTQTYVYHANNSKDIAENGIYIKWLKGAEALLTLPTVIVNVTDNGEKYDFLIEFTCKNESPQIEVTELRFSSRSPIISDQQFQKMKQTALAVGISQELVDSVKFVNHSSCDDRSKGRDYMKQVVDDAPKRIKQVIDKIND